MGDVVHVEFGTEREWAQTRERIVNGLVAIGALFGDDEKLMRAKAESVYILLRRVIDDIPSISVNARMPENLGDQDLDIVTEAIRVAALRGVEAAMTHAVQAMMESIYDLCTSKLAQPGGRR